ncbi:MAG: SDR family oxidoreductase [Actinomycetota bacterium]|nr:SDR family oxidoreductase [Actinomycetota bacterium]
MVVDPPTGAGAPPPTLVVGGTGHVGAALCLHLVESGGRVVATARRPSPGFDHPRIKEVRFDLHRPTDGIPHPGPTTAMVSPWVLDGEAAPDWLERLLDHLAGRGLRTVVLFSTVWVYGDSLVGTVTEATHPKPSNTYGAAHLANERILERATDRLGLDGAVLRMTNLVGADPFHARHGPDSVSVDLGRRNDGRKVSFTHDLAAMALTDDRIVLRSPPSTRRDLLARGLLHHRIDALLARATVPGRYEAFNVGGGRTTTMGDFARTVAEAASRYHGRPVAIEHPDDSTSLPAFNLDSTRIEEVAGLCPNDLAHEVSLVIGDVLAARGGHR